MPSAFLTGKAAAGGIAMVNTILSVGGFIGPVLVGRLKGEADDYTAGLLILSAVAVLAALLTLPLRRAVALAGPRA
jgi:hypothetical protein